MLVIHADQHFVPDRPGTEVRLQLGIDADRIELAAGIERTAPQLLLRRRVPAHRIDPGIGQVAVHVAHVLPHAEGVVEAMLERVADRVFLAVERIEGRLAGEEPDRDPAAVHRRNDRALARQEVDRGALLVALVVRQQREGGIGGGAERQGGRNEDAVVLGMLGLRIALAEQAGQPIEHGLVAVHRAGQVEAGLLPIVRTILQIDLAQRLGGRPLADQVDEAARRVGAVQHRTRAAQQLDALEPIGVDTRHQVAARVVVDVQAVEILPRGEAADHRLVIARLDHVVADHAGRIGEGLGHVLHAAVFHLLAGDHRNRLRRLRQRRIGLGRGDAAPGDIAAHRAGSRLRPGGPDGDLGQLARHGLARRRGLLLCMRAARQRKQHHYRPPNLRPPAIEHPLHETPLLFGSRSPGTQKGSP